MYSYVFRGCGQLLKRSYTVYSHTSNATFGIPAKRLNNTRYFSGRNIGYNLGDKSVFSPVNYLLRRYRNPVRGHHLPSGDNYSALIFNWGILMSRTFIPLSVSLLNDLADPVLDGVGLAGCKGRANAFLLSYAALFLVFHIVFYYFPLSLRSACLYCRLVLYGWGLRTDRVYITLSQPCTTVLF